MFDGTIKVVEDVVVGDLLMGPDNEPRTVLRTSRGFGSLFQVKQNGGEPYVVNENHVLSLRRMGESSWGRYPQFGRFADIPVKDYLNSSKRFKSLFYGYRAGEVEFPERELPIPPYIFGVWLGDGSKSIQSITSMDSEIIDEYIKWGETIGLLYYIRHKANNKAITVILVSSFGKGSGRRGSNIGKKKLRELGVLGNKHVPFIYQTCSLEQRLEFLAGFIDTDGYFSQRNGCKGYQYTIGQKDEGILRSVKFIADTCGFKTSLRARNKIFNGKPYEFWSLSISGWLDKIPCRLPRKQCKTWIKDQDHTIGAISLSAVGEGEFAGFELDGDHRFLLSDCTVTHNSHFVAEQIIEDCTLEHHRVACLREYQSSIKESSKQLLEDKIKWLGVEDLFDTTRDEIRGPFDSLIVFKGLQGSSAHSIRSLEGFSRAWVEEAQSISQASLDIMTPSFRRTPNMIGEPEMYFVWNPLEPRDPVETMFRKPGTEREDAFTPTDDDDFVCVTANYKNNPWFPPDLRRDMERARRRDPELYAHVWLGQYQRKSQSRIFHNIRLEAFETPSDARFFFGADWGFGDPTVLVRCFIKGLSFYVDYEAYKSNCKIEATPALFATIPGSKKWPIRADSSRPETIDYMRDHGYPRITPAVKGPNSVEDGIEFLKNYDIVVHPRCENTWDELCVYSYKVDKRTGDVLPVVAEGQSDHSCIAEGVLVVTFRGDVPIEQVKVGDFVLTRKGYRRVISSGCVGINRRIMRITTNTGNILLCTPDHLVAAGNDFVSADSLSALHQLISIVPVRDLGRSIVHDRIYIMEEGAVANVYDLTIEGEHEFFANGVLVHNCDSLRYALEGERLAPKLIVPTKAAIRRMRARGFTRPRLDRFLVGS
jgi:phage terminase large subunit